MTLGEFRTVIRLMVPSANKTRVSDATMDVLINKGIRDVNHSAKVLIQKKYFDAAASDGDYVISAIANIIDFVLVGDSGLWFNKGTVASTNYHQLEGVDRAFLDKNYPNWQDGDVGDPLYAIFEPNLITVYPAPSSALVNGFLLPDYVYKPPTLDNDDNYPFSNSTTEYPALEVLDDAIVDYARWALAFSVGKKNEGVVTRQIYEQTLRNSSRLFRRRPDFKASHNFRIKSVRGYH